MTQLAEYPLKMFCFSAAKVPNEMDIRKSSQATLTMSIAHYLLITGNLKGKGKYIQKDAFMFY
jgi:hypothetical protein